MTCPVCRKPVNTNAGGNCIARHRDKASWICPASGQPKHITDMGEH